MASQPNDHQESCSHNDECDGLKEKLVGLTHPPCSAEESTNSGNGTRLDDTHKGAENTMNCTDTFNSSVLGDPGIATTDNTPSSSSVQETITLKVVYKKQKFDVIFSLDSTISELKVHLQKLTSVPSAMQKLMYKGLAKDECTLRQLNMTNGAKIIVIGSTINDVLEVATPTETVAESASSAPTKEALCKQKVGEIRYTKNSAGEKCTAKTYSPDGSIEAHQRVLEKYGKPEDAIIGIKNRKDRLPTCPLTGMYNKNGGKVRLTFKLELDQLWIGTKERTEKIPMNSIKTVVSEAIEGHEEYHLMGIQLGPTEASRYWVYWVPAQYVDAVKDAILGKWQFYG